MLLLCFISVSLLSHLENADASRFTTPVVQDEVSSESYLVKVNNTFAKNHIKSKYDFTDLKKSSEKDIDNWIKVKIKNKNELDKLRKEDGVKVVVKDQKRQLLTKPNDPCFSTFGSPCSASANSDPNQDGQWNLRKICLGAFASSSPCASAWENQSVTGSNTNPVVAVIDTGIDLTHPDLVNNVWTNPTPNADVNYPNALHGWNFADGNNNVQDTNGHGTHVSGIIAAQGDNTTGITGICWSCKIMVLKVVNSQGFAYDSDIALAIRYAVDNGARILNMSLGGPGYSQALQDAIDYAWSGGNIATPDLSKSVLIVSAAGNNSASASNSYPGGMTDSLSIGATDYLDSIAGYSNTGPKLDVVAPGSNILSTKLQSIGAGCLGSIDYYCLSGTSMASPHVAGLAALLWDKNPTWNSRQIRYAILKNTTDLGTAGFDSSSGFGRINTLTSLQSLVMSSDSTPPTASLTTPANGTVQNTWNITGTASDTNLYLYQITIERISDGAITQFAGRSSISNSTLYSLNTTAFANDYYNISMTVEDFAGNVTSSNTLTNIVFENSAPGSFDLSTPSNNVWINTARPTFTWQGAASVSTVTYDLYVDSALKASNITQTSYTLTSDITEAAHTWYVIANNSTQVPTQSTSTYTVKVDITPPNNFTGSASVTGSDAVFTFSTTDGLSGILRYDLVLPGGAAFANVTSPYMVVNNTDWGGSAHIYAYDIAGNTRIADVDIRTQYLHSKGDVNASGKVDLSDLSILAQYYGQNTSSGDVNGNGKVDLTDLSILASNWLQSF